MLATVALPKFMRTRTGGVLLHPTSLPSRYGIGDLGPGARDWVDLLASARQRWWQFLPLGPAGYDDSPYQCLSAFASNPHLISPDDLVADGLLRKDDLPALSFADDHVDFWPVSHLKRKLLAQAWDNFQSGKAPALTAAFERFCVEEAGWLEDFALFMTLKDAHGGMSWLKWDNALRRREPSALAQVREHKEESLRQVKFQQFLFFRQWQALRDYAHARNLGLIGDIPSFVATDCVDVWKYPHYFQLDDDRHPTRVIGSPPDFFNATGQVWGYPLYNWDALKQDGYTWWQDRLRAAFQRVDVVRLTHFRGFEACWAVPASLTTAEHGQWIQGPGADFFQAMTASREELALIADDVGVTSPAVDALRRQFQFPGIRLLQFAFDGDAANRFLPHNYEPNTVVYVGTHDTNTAHGWYRLASEAERETVRRYLDRDGRNISWDLIRAAWSSIAQMAIVPLQDVLSLDLRARMNVPGASHGNWIWRCSPAAPLAASFARLAELTTQYGRAA